MNRLISEHTIELLDRKYNFVMNSSTETFILDLEQFMNYLTQDELISPFTSKLTQIFKEKSDQYQKQLAKEVQEAKEIKNIFLHQYPKCDDSNAQLSQYPQTGDASTRCTFAYFNWVLTTEANYQGDSISDLISILGFKISQNERNDANNEISIRHYSLETRHEHTVRNWKNYLCISSGQALREVEDQVGKINPSPDNDDWPYTAMAAEGSWVQQSVYSPNSISKEDLKKEIQSLKCKLKRVYEAIRQEIGTTRLHLQLLDRYRIRCRWYNQEQLRKLVLDEQEKLIRGREDILTRDLALYLYDQGTTVIYRLRLGSHEPDLIEIDAKNPMFVEAKAYKDSSAKAELISGISQLHSYLCSYEAYRNISEAYYVIFRLGGPIYEFPYSISTNRFTIYPIFVDIGSSEDSGRKQKKPILISENEILEPIKIAEQN